MRTILKQQHPMPLTNSPPSHCSSVYTANVHNSTPPMKTYCPSPILLFVATCQPAEDDYWQSQTIWCHLHLLSTNFFVTNCAVPNFTFYACYSGWHADCPPLSQYHVFVIFGVTPLFSSPPSICQGQGANSFFSSATWGRRIWRPFFVCCFLYVAPFLPFIFTTGYCKICD